MPSGYARPREFGRGAAMISISYGTAHAGRRRTARQASATAIVLTLVGLTLTGAGLIRLAGLPWHEAATSLSARFWPAAEARILSASIGEARKPGEKNSALTLSVEYEFETAGGTFVGTSASLADNSDMEERRLLLLFRRIEFARVTGRSMPVVYDPADPSRAFLDTSIPWRDTLPRLALGMVFLFFGGPFLTRAVRPVELPRRP